MDAAPTNPEVYEFLGTSMVLLFLGLFFLFLLLLVFIMWLGWWFTSREGTPCPYTGGVLHKCDRLAFSAVESVLTFLTDLDEVDNPPFDLQYAAFCPRTGRLFPDAVGVLGVIRVKWNFLNDRCPGRWVSWGSLSELEQQDILRYHDDVKQYQTEKSSVRARPQDVDAYHALLRPGPLYVDVGTKTLLGWQVVPGTTLEVLIVRRPRYEYQFGLED